MDVMDGSSASWPSTTELRALWLSLLYQLVTLEATGIPADTPEVIVGFPDPGLRGKCIPNRSSGERLVGIAKCGAHRPFPRSANLPYKFHPSKSQCYSKPFIVILPRIAQVEVNISILPRLLYHFQSVHQFRPFIAIMSPSAIESLGSCCSNTSSSPRPRVAVVMGDPAGIGPELAAKLLADSENYQKADIFVLADLSEVHRAASLANVSIPIIATAGPTGVQVLDDHTAPLTPIEVGKVSKAAGERVMHQLTRGVELANAGKIDAIFFTPLNKTSCHLAGMHEEDELRWFAKALKYDGVTSEINITTGLWTSRVTSHIGIKDVASRVTKQGVFDAIELLHTSL